MTALRKIFCELLRIISRNPPFYTGNENGQVCEKCGKSDWGA